MSEKLGSEFQLKPIRHELGKSHLVVGAPSHHNQNVVRMWSIFGSRSPTGMCDTTFVNYTGCAGQISPVHGLMVSNGTDFVAHFDVVFALLTWTLVFMFN